MEQEVGSKYSQMLTALGHSPDILGDTERPGEQSVIPGAHMKTLSFPLPLHWINSVNPDDKTRKHEKYVCRAVPRSKSRAAERAEPPVGCANSHPPLFFPLCPCGLRTASLPQWKQAHDQTELPSFCPLSLYFMLFLRTEMVDFFFQSFHCW